MSDQEMKDLWKGQSRSVVNLEPAILQELSTQITSMHERIKKRDIQESLAGIFVMLAFGVVAYFMENPFVKAGAIVEVLFGLMVIVILFLNRKLRKTEEPDRPIKEQLQEELTFLRKQQWLLKNVAVWYIAPCFVGLLLFHYGLNESWYGFAFHILLVIGLCLCIYKMNQDAVKKDINPAIQKVQEVLLRLEEV